MSGIKSMSVDSLVCFTEKGDECEQFRIDNRVRQGCIMFPWLFNIYMDAMIKEGNEIHGRWKKVKIDWLFVCR